MTNLTFDDVCKAQNRIKNHINKTPIFTNEFLNEKLGAQFFFKCENFQKTGSFKIRGATNKLLSYQEEHKKLPEKIVAISSGNHAQAVAYLTKQFGIKDNIIYMEKKTSPYKIAATKSHGANIFLTQNRQEMDLFAEEKVREGYFFIHSSNANETLCGQGTAALEAYQEVGEFDAAFAPCGGGGLIAGTFLALQNQKKKAQVFAVEPAIANDAAITYRSGKLHILPDSPNSIADGARTLRVSDSNLPYLKQLNGVFEIPEEDIICWTQILTSYLKIAIEPTAALSMAGAISFLKENKNQNEHPKILIILSGGNFSAITAKQVWEKDYLSDFLLK